MAHVKKNIVTQGLSGTLGGTIVFRQVGDRTIVATPPTVSGPPTAKQAQQRQRFQEASFYAKSQMLDPARKQAYETAGDERDLTGYTIAVADFLQGPDIQEVDLTHYHGKVGDTIRVRVTDGFRVAQVQVRITNGDGTLVEDGKAVQQPNVLDWLYTATKSNTTLQGDKITVSAFDLPGNLSQEETSL